MIFPFILKKQHEYPLESENFGISEATLIEWISAIARQKLKPQEIQSSGKRLTVGSQKSLFGIWFLVVFEVEKRDLDFRIRYRLKMTHHLLVLLFILISLYLLFIHTISIFLIIAAVFSPVFYLVCALYLIHSTNALLNDIPFLHADETESLNQKQKEWINNPYQCPACGAYITPYNKYCPECRLRVRKKAPKPAANHSSADKKTELNYHYKEKK